MPLVIDGMQERLANLRSHWVVFSTAPLIQLHLTQQRLDRPLRSFARRFLRLRRKIPEICPWTTRTYPRSKIPCNRGKHEHTCLVKQTAWGECRARACWRAAHRQLRNLWIESAAAFTESRDLSLNSTGRSCTKYVVPAALGMWRAFGRHIHLDRFSRRFSARPISCRLAIGSFRWLSGPVRTPVTMNCIPIRPIRWDEVSTFGGRTTNPRVPKPLIRARLAALDLCAKHNDLPFTAGGITRRRRRSSLCERKPADDPATRPRPV